MMDWDDTRIVFTKRSLIEFLKLVIHTYFISLSHNLHKLVGTLVSPLTLTLLTLASFQVPKFSFCRICISANA
jgi:hypothetical protein